MARSERERLEDAIEAAEGSTEALRAVFDDLEDRLGHEEASELWWAVLGARDATHT